MNVRILIADDHEVIRQGIRMILQARQKWEICGEATNGHDTIRLVRELKPDISIVDITMPGLSGLEATQQITRHSDSKILIFTMHESATLADSVRRVGARGYVSKSQATRQLVQAIESILDGGTFFNDSRKEVKEPGDPGPDPILLCSALAWA